jgi:endonuclease G, mitochondrial
MGTKSKYIIFLGALLIITLQLLAQKPKYEQLQIPTVKKNETKICHKYWCFVYSEEHEQSKWVAYKLTSQMLSGDEERDDNFKPDPLVATGSAEDKDYKGSGYDRGHLAPAADMSFDKIAMEESFYFSNISPQVPSFNRGVWKKLETYVRSAAKNLGTVYVVTGPILKSGLSEIGENGVDVPEKYYKTILYFSDTLITGIAFIMPNQKVSDNDIFNYTATIDELEKLSGIDFWPALPYFIEKKTEKQINIDFWKQYKP